MRAMYSSAMKRAVYFPDFIPSASSPTVTSSKPIIRISGLHFVEAIAFSVVANRGNATTATPPARPVFKNPLRLSWFPDSSLLRMALSFRFVVLGHCSLVIVHWSLIIGHWSLFIAHWSLIIGH